ncbi:hypothetical protein [Actinoallomurus iriomotensis]|uniref:Uncharacterized protein n=1 Tax=Actinoallomurus iriomotensis TaxID=478107 RepID=A0A9W6W635_9ACTN|nr:hypothetical protein [Actinoallomurus iriomotensis]GLY92705.1 hypothetical protein Airi02_106330 [Actinoallomurus iriomotensis]
MLRFQCGYLVRGSPVGRPAGVSLGVADALGRTSGRGLEEPSIVDDEVCGRRADPDGPGVAPTGPEAGDVEDDSAMGGSPAPGLFPAEPPVSASVRAAIAATSTAAAVIIRRTPWRNRISSSRA